MTGASCEIRLSFIESGVGAFAYDCGGGDPAEGSFRLTTGSLFVPVILSAAGQNQSFFTSELTLTNRGDQDVKLDYSYTAERGGGSGTALEVLAAGRQEGGDRRPGLSTEPGDTDSRNGQPDRDAEGGRPVGVRGGSGGADDDCGA